jgi:hypothetical protein
METMTGDGVRVVADAMGLVSSAALTWQSYRLVRHLRAVRELRQLGQRQGGDAPMGELARKGADVLERTVSRWDATDERLVVIGMVGLTFSFVLKLVAVAMG